MKITVPVVGVTFEGRQLILESLYNDQENSVTLTGRLVREPDNKYDPGAIAVEVQSQKVGYIPRALKALKKEMAARMDAGESIPVVGVSISKSEINGRKVYSARLDVEIQEKGGCVNGK